MSSNHTLVSRDTWTEMQQQVSMLDAYLVNNEHQIATLRREHERRMEEIRNQAAAHDRAVTHAIDALAEAYRTNLQQVREQFGEELEQQSDEFRGQLDALLTDVGNISGRLGGANSRLQDLASRYDAAFRARLEQGEGSRQRAELTLAELDRLLEEIRSLQPEQFRPIDYATLQTLRNSVALNVRNGDYQAASAVSQGSILTATRVLAQLTMDNAAFGSQLEAVRTEAAALENRFHELGSDAGVLPVTIQGQRQEYDYQIDYWSGGEFAALRQRLDQLQTRLREPQLSLTELTRLGNEVTRLRSDLERCDGQARNAMVSAVFVEETADRLTTVLEEQGWEATLDQHHEDDARAPYTMEFDDGDGNTVALVVSRGNRTDEPIYSLEVYSDNVYRAEDIKDGIHAAMNDGETRVGRVTRRNDCHLNPDPATFLENMVQEAQQRQ